LNDNPIKGLIVVLSVEQVLSAKLVRIQLKCSNVMVQRLSKLWLWTSQVKEYIAYVRLMCISQRQLVKPQKKALRYRVHRRWSRRPRYPKAGVNKKS
jgi:hypothetical protein